MHRLSPPIRLAFALAVLLAASLSAGRPAMAQADAAAQTDAPAVVPPELSDEARRKYAQGLKEVRELIARKDYADADDPDRRVACASGRARRRRGF